MRLSEERAAERDDLSETFADLLFSVEVTKGNVFITLGVVRVDHRGKTKIRAEIPVARLVMPHKTARELAVGLQGAVQAMDNPDKPIGDDHRASLTLAKRRTN